MSATHFTQPKALTPEQTSKRLGGVSVHTLANWRSQGTGPIYQKIGGRIMYLIEDIEAFEHSSRRKSTSEIV